MNMLKKRVDYFLQFLLRMRIEKSLNEGARKKINELRKNDRFRPYPVKEHPPLIHKCSFFKKTDARWLDLFYSVHGIADRGFIPLPVYYNHIEPRLNNGLLTPAVKEKNFYDQFLKNIKTPPTVIRRINGGYYDMNFDHINLDDGLLYQILKNIPVVILKPSVASGSGRSILRFTGNDDGLYAGNDKLDTDFLNKYRSDFVLQIFIRQPDFFRQFNPESNNTIRILTYRSTNDDKISILHTLLRIGKKGSYLDHDNLGGVAVAVSETGILKESAYDVSGNKYESFNGIEFKRVGEVPFIREIRSTAIKTAKQIFYGRLLAMDFTVDHNGEVLLIEINCKGNGISQYQYSNGSLFRQFTNEIIEYCNSRPTKINIIHTPVN